MAALAKNRGGATSARSRRLAVAGPRQQSCNAAGRRAAARNPGPRLWDQEAGFLGLTGADGTGRALTHSRHEPQF